MNWKRWAGGEKGWGGTKAQQQNDRNKACLDVDLGFLSVSIASNNGLGERGDIHSSIALPCNPQQKVLCISRF